MFYFIKSLPCVDKKFPQAVCENPAGLGKEMSLAK